MTPNELREAYPLSPMQAGMLFQHLVDSKSGVNIEQLVCSFSNIEPSSLKLAWEQVWQAHAVLRLGFQWANLDAPLQSIHHELILPWQEINWQAKTEPQTVLEDFLRRDRIQGFDLSQPPLMRLTLIQRSKTDFWLVWSYHHILLDGRSILTILRHIAEAYESISNGQKVGLPKLRPFRDYIQWLGETDLSADKEYWREKMRNVQPPVPLAGLASNPSFVDGELKYGLAKAYLSEELTNRLRRFVETHSLSMNALLQGAWATVLHRYGAGTDLVFGTIRTGRYSALVGEGTRDMVGLMINTLPVRVEVDPKSPIMSILKELRKEALALRGNVHEHVSLAEIQQMSGVQGRLFETIFAFENFELNEVVKTQHPLLANWDVELIEHIGYPLSLEVYAGKRLKLLLEFSREHFDAATAERILQHVQILLESILSNPEQKVSQLAIVGEAERRLLLEEWNQTQVEYPQRCVQELFEDQAKRTPDAIAVVYENSQLTYQELNQKANQLAYELIQRGIGADSLVGIYMERSLEMVIGLLGILKAGGAYVPIDPSYPEERRKYILQDSGVKIVLTQTWLTTENPFSADVTTLNLDGDEWNKFNLHPDTDPQGRAGLNNLAYMIYTSGSTGKPKGALIEHRGLTNYLNWCLRAYPQDGRGSPVHSSLSFDLTVTGIYPALLSGKTAWMLPERTNIEALEQIVKREQDFSLIKITPAHLKLLNEQLSSINVHNKTRAFVIGGENLYAEHVNFWVENAPETLLINEYGPTETVVGCCVYVVPKGEKPQGVIPIGEPIDNTRLYVLDDNLQPVPIGVTGELYIGGVGVARGYWQRPDLTAERFIRDPFVSDGRMYKTGDRVRWRADGNLEFLGRLDDQVKVRGYRIELGEVETALEELAGVKQATVVVDAHVGGEKRLVGYVVGEGVSIPALREHMKAKLPEYMQPALYVLLDEMPLTPNGKVDRKALPKPQAADALTAEYVPPQTEMEKILAGIWSELLDLPRVGRNDNFFELGGHSLFAIRLFVRVRSAFDVDVPVSVLFEAATLTDLARRIENVIWVTKQTSQKNAGGDENLFEEFIL